MARRKIKDRKRSEWEARGRAAEEAGEPIEDFVEEEPTIHECWIFAHQHLKDGTYVNESSKVVGERIVSNYVFAKYFFYHAQTSLC